ncbi:MAG: sensor histidine kinase [Rhodospirillales bacterium]|nr:sensor histidine kinase [Rhodospirillales bacterium]
MGPSFSRSFSYRQSILWIASAALLVIAVLLAGRLVESAQIGQLTDDGAARTEHYARLLNGELSKYNYLPEIVQLNPQVLALMRSPPVPGQVDRVNRYLDAVNDAAGSAALYLVDQRGQVLAASNWAKPTSFVGIDLSYRPYVRDGLQAGAAEFYGVGTTSGEAGYYFARAIDADGVRLGVAVVKVALDGVKNPFGWGTDPAMVVDEYGVVILSSVPGWQFHTLHELAPDVLAVVRANRKYAHVELHPLGLRVEQPVADGIDVISLPEESGGHRLRMLAQEASLGHSDWKIVVLSELTDVRLLTRAAQAVTALGLGSLLLGSLYLSARRRAIRIRLAAKEALERANQELERKVLERTRDLTCVNVRLRDEVAERERAEQVLRETQDELVHAGKLAVIGQMAAGMTHELNQPVAALRTLADNALLLLERNKPQSVRANLEMIVRTVERMAKITGQLKGFARKGEGRPGLAAIGVCLEHALALVENRLSRQQIEVVCDAIPSAVMVLCDPGRLEQVLVNLLTNALDALGETPRGRIEITVTRAEAKAETRQDGNHRITIAVSDNGPGIPAAVLPRLFEPFFTTKAAGVGLGLGLTISEGIVRQCGGSLLAENRPSGGARVVIELAETVREEASIEQPA